LGGSPVQDGEANNHIRPAGDIAIGVYHLHEPQLSIIRDHLTGKYRLVLLSRCRSVSVCMESEFRSRNFGKKQTVADTIIVSQEFLDSLANKTSDRTQAHPVWLVFIDENGANISRETIDLVDLLQEEDYNSMETRLIDIAQVTGS
jgi:hypothetical protein